MKKGIFILFAAILALSLISCDKKTEGPGNNFAFDGKNYTINQAFLTKIVVNSGLANEADFYQFLFLNIDGSDTTALLMAMFDANSNVLDGSYTSVDQLADATRGVVPFGLIIVSAVSLANGTVYFTGAGGTFDVTMTGDKFDIKMNSISAGDYNDMFDDNSDGNSEYTEVGKIKGLFKGSISMQVNNLSRKSASTDPIVNRIIEKFKK